MMTHHRRLLQNDSLRLVLLSWMVAHTFHHRMHCPEPWRTEVLGPPRSYAHVLEPCARLRLYDVLLLLPPFHAWLPPSYGVPLLPFGLLLLLSVGLLHLQFAELHPFYAFLLSESLP